MRSFFISYRRRYNLDAMVREHDAERGNAHHIQAGKHLSTRDLIIKRNRKNKMKACTVERKCSTQGISYCIIIVCY